MIDTIELTSDKYNRRNYKPPNSTLPFKSIEYVSKKKTYDIYMHMGMEISLSDSKMKISGSLTKYILGHNLNFELGNLTDVKEAFIKLEDNLGVDLSDFRIRRFDFGRCFDLKEPAYKYLQNLLSLERHRTTIYGVTGKNFRNISRSIVFYDKLAEMRGTSKDISTNEIGIIMDILNLEGKNILRFEYQIHKPDDLFVSIKKEYGFSKNAKKLLTVKNFLDKTIFNIMVLGYYHKIYEDIEKRHVIKISDLRGKKPGEIKDIFFLNGVINYGEDRFQKDIDFLKANAEDTSGLNSFVRGMKSKKLEYCSLVDNLEELGSLIRKSTQNAISISESRQLEDSRLMLYNVILRKIKEERTTNSDMRLEGISGFWSQEGFDFSITDSDENIAHRIVKEIIEKQRPFNEKNGKRTYSGLDVLIVALEIVRKEYDEKLSQKHFMDMTLVEYLNEIAKSYTPNH